MLKHYAFHELAVGDQFQFTDFDTGHRFWAKKMSSRTSRIVATGTLCWHGLYADVYAGAK